MKGYYYCSLNTFLNIIKSKQIYLSDPLKMNDNLEIKWYLERLNETKIEDDVFDNIFEIMKLRSGIEFTLQELNDCIDSIGQNSVYICCFSKDGDRLSQWRSYADNGCGVSIGFDLDKMAVADNIFIREVVYNNDVIFGEHETDVEIVADSMGTVISEHNIKDKKKQIEVFLHELIPILAQYKNPAFIEENEVRLIYCDDLKFEKIIDKHGAFQEKWTNKELEHDFRAIGNNDITEFVKLDFDIDLVEDIYVGPKCLLSENDVINLVKKTIGKEISVSKSKSSYR